jgi:peptidyl-tRNA hydrolase
VTADDPLVMYLVVRRGAVPDLATAGALAGAAAVSCVRGFATDERFAAALEAWRPRPRKVCLRARGGQWDQVLAQPHAGEADHGVIALPPCRRSSRAGVVGRLQAMSTALDPAPQRAPPADDAPTPTCVVNPAATMTSGKTLAQIAHAAVMAVDGGGLGEWIAEGCPGRVLAPGAPAFAAAAQSDGCLARVVDAGLTEIAPGTVTVLALAPGPAKALPPALRAA